MSSWRSPHEAADPIQSKKKRNALLLALGFGLVGLVAQGIGAFYSGSLALASDTAHLFADNASLFVSLIALWAAQKACIGARSFGFYRAEVLASFTNGVLLAVVALGIFWEAIERIQEPKMILAGPLILIASLGLAFNLLSAFVLFRALKGEHHHGHTHHHQDHAHTHNAGHTCSGHHHDHQDHEGKAKNYQEDRNLKGALLHVMSDALGSVAVILGAVFIYFTGWEAIDAWIGLVLGLLIAHWAYRFLKETIHVLLEASPAHIDLEKLQAGIRQLDSRIQKLEHLHVWEITSNMYASSMEIFVDPKMPVQEAEALRQNIDTKLREQGIYHNATVMRC